MPYAVNLLLDDDTAAPVRRLTRMVEEALPGEGGFSVETHTPHVTLVVIPDEAVSEDIQTAAFDGLVLTTALPIVLSGIGFFPKANAVWLAPAATPQLIALQQSLISALGDLPIDPLYGPGHWVPHLSVGRTDMDRRGAVIDVLASLWEGPIIGFANRLELATFYPVNVLRSRELPPFG